MKIKLFLTYILILFFLFFKAVSEEVEFEALKIDIKEDGNIVFAENSKTIIPAEKIRITSDKVKYDKKTDIILFTKNVVFNDLISDIIIKGNKVTYNKSENLIFSEGDTKEKCCSNYFST